MLEAHRPNGRFFYGLVMVLVVGWSLVPACPVIAADAAPATTHLSEGLFGSHTGEQKKESAISFVAAALQLTESVPIEKLWMKTSSKMDLEKLLMEQCSA